MQRSRRALLCVGLALTIGGCSGAPKSTLAGVYTTEQAARGRDVYAGMCISCHAGMGNHVGPVFRKWWAGRDLLDMYRFMSYNMPKNEPGTLAPDEYLAVIAFLLERNGMPPGRSPLTVDTTALKAIIYDTLPVKR